MRANGVDYRRVKFLYRQGLTDREIAEEVKCSRSSIQDWRERCGLVSNSRKRKGRRKKSELSQIAQEARKAGLTYGKYVAREGL